MRKLRADWKCDWCGQEYTDSKGVSRPVGWHEVDVMVDGQYPTINRHFCCQEHLDEWKGAAGL